MSIATYVINLDQSKDRLAHFVASAEEAGLSFERLTAICGEDLPEGIAGPLRKIAGSSSLLTKSQLGCLLSHRRAWEMILAEGAAWGMVLEDDVVLAHDFSALVADDSWLPPDADLIKLETVGSRVVTAGGGFPAPNGRLLLRLYSPHLGTAGYLVSAKAAGFLLRSTAGATCPVDVALFDPAFGINPSLTIYQMSPSPCQQSLELATTIRIDRAPPPRRSLARAGYRLTTPLRRVWRYLSRQAQARAVGGHYGRIPSG